MSGQSVPPSSAIPCIEIKTRTRHATARKLQNRQREQKANITHPPFFIFLFHGNLADDFFLPKSRNLSAAAYHISIRLSSSTRK